MFDPWVRKISPERKWQPVFDSCLGSPMDREAWRATVHGVAKSQTWLSVWTDTHTHTHTHTHTKTQMSALGSVFGMKVRKDWSITLHPLQSCPWPPYPTVASRRPHRGCLLLHEGPLHSSALVASLQTVWSVVKGEPEAGVKQDGDLSQGTNWWYVSSDGPAHHWRSIRVWINKGRDRWNCWGGRFQLAAQDHFLLAEAVKLWLWPGSLIWRPSAFLDSPLAVVEWARVRMRGSFQWPPGCW